MYGAVRQLDGHATISHCSSSLCRKNPRKLPKKLEFVK